MEIKDVISCGPIKVRNINRGAGRNRGEGERVESFPRNVYNLVYSPIKPFFSRKGGRWSRGSRGVKFTVFARVSVRAWGGPGARASGQGRARGSAARGESGVGLGVWGGPGAGGVAWGPEARAERPG